MQRITVRLTVVLLAMLCAVGFATAPAQAQAQTFTDNVQEPIAITVFVDCANGGAGELVELSGVLHVLFHTTVDAQGGVHVEAHFQPQGVTGVGVTTGDKYQGTGVTQDHFHIGADGLPVNFSFVNNFRIIGQGSGNNFLVHDTFHVTINANGQVTAEVSNFRAECK